MTNSQSKSEQPSNQQLLQENLCKESIKDSGNNESTETKQQEFIVNPYFKIITNY